MAEQRFNIDSLDSEQRLQLMEELWESLSSDPESIPLMEGQESELNRRLDEIDAGDTEGIPWEEVMNQVQARLG